MEVMHSLYTTCVVLLTPDVQLYCSLSQQRSKGLGRKEGGDITSHLHWESGTPTVDVDSESVPCSSIDDPGTAECLQGTSKTPYHTFVYHITVQILAQ